MSIPYFFPNTHVNLFKISKNIEFLALTVNMWHGKVPLPVDRGQIHLQITNVLNSTLEALHRVQVRITRRPNHIRFVHINWTGTTKQLTTEKQINKLNKLTFS